MNLFQRLNDPMELATEIAKKSFNEVDVPVACVIVNSKKELISYASNVVIKNNDATAHAEIEAIRKACKVVKDSKLYDMSLYVTLEPCTMCESAIYQARIKEVFFGAYNRNFRNTFKNIRYKYNYSKKKFQFFGGFKEEENSLLLKKYFKEVRKNNYS